MIWIIFAACATLSFLLTGFIRQIARSGSMIAIPNERSSHSVATPQGGGIAIATAFMLALVALALGHQLDVSSLMLFLLFGSCIATIGMLDDIFHLSASLRLLAHCVTAALALYWLGGMPPVSVAGRVLNLGLLGHGLALIYLVWLLNLYNFMDGIDGIAGIEAITVCVGGTLIGLLHGIDREMFLAPLALIAATSGFLVWNFPRARIFMGDAGSAFIGFVIGLLTIQAASSTYDLFWGWLVLLGCFIVDATVTLIRRVTRGEKFYLAHRSHAYQNASRIYRSHTVVSVAVGAINLFWLLPIAVTVALGWLDGLLAVAIAYLPLIYLALRLKAGVAEASH